MRLNGNANLENKKLQDLKFHLGLHELLLLEDFHVDVWSCMDDVVLHNVLQRLFPQHIICRLTFM